jgi:hypothetical protein
VTDSWCFSGVPIVGTPVSVASVNSARNDAGPELSFDGETLYFNSTLPGETAFVLFVATAIADGPNKN